MAKMHFENCVIATEGGYTYYDFDGHRFHDFEAFARYVDTHGGKIWFKSGDVIKVYAPWKE